MVLLHTPAQLRGEQMRTVGEFDVNAGQTVPFVLTHGASHRPPPPCADPDTALAATEAFWTEWLGPGKASGPWAGAENRSALTLKALTYAHGRGANDITA